MRLLSACMMVLALSLMVPAEPLDVTVDSSGPVRLLGDWEGSMDLRMMVAEPAGVEGQTLLHVDSARAVLHEATLASSNSTVKVGPQEVWFFEDYPIAEESQELNGDLTVLDQESYSLIKVLPPEPWTVLSIKSEDGPEMSLEGPRMFSSSRSGQDSFPHSHTIANQETNARGPGLLWTTNGSGIVELEAPFRLYLEGVTLRTEQKDRHYGQRYSSEEDEVGWSLPLTEGSTAERTYTVAVVQVLEGQAVFRPGTSWGAVIAGLQGSLDGQIRFAGNELAGYWNETELPETAHALRTGGLFEMDMVMQDDMVSTWQMEGEAHSLSVDGEPLFHISTGTAVAGLGLLGLLTFVLIRVLGLPLIGARHRAAPLKHPLRQQLMKLIESEPGLTRTEMATRLDTTRHNVMFHLSVLEQHGFVDRERRGRFLHYMPNQGSYRKVLSAQGGKPIRLRRIVASLKNKERKRIFEFLLQQSQPLPLSRLQESLDLADGHKGRLIYHLQIMRREGMLERLDDGWRAQPALKDLPEVLKAAHRRAEGHTGVGA